MKKTLFSLLLLFNMSDAEILSLKSGWSLVGANSSMTLDTLKNQIGAENLLIVQGQQKTYQKFYEDEGKNFLNSFNQFEKGRGYWIKVNSAIDLPYNRITYTTDEHIDLIAGWNLINPPTDLNLSEIVAQLGENLLVIQGQKDTYQKIYNEEGKDFLNSFENFKEPYAYWVKVTKNITLHFPKIVDTTAPLKAILTTTPTTTSYIQELVEINGEVGATVWINGIKEGTIDNDGIITISLDTSGGEGIKRFSIVLRDANNNESEPLIVEIKKLIDDAIAIRFLDKATFGATKENIKALKHDGIEVWIDKQLAMPIQEDIYLKKTIELAKLCEPENNSYSIEAYLNDNDKIFNQNVGSFFSPRYRMSAWFEVALDAPDQLRQKMTYALSQIIVESDFEPIFTRRAEALARYFDILHHHALGNYKQLITDISFSSGMGMFLTYNGNKKAYQNEANITIYPDENYARELMQLFSMGLNELNLDGTAKKDEQGNLIPTYSQEDVNELSKVFTGWDLKRNRRYGLIGFRRGDLTHPMEFTQKYHDFTAKSLLNQSISSGLDGEADVKRAIDIIFSNPNVAPFIAKNLIMRLSKSNPSPMYVGRVASVFLESQGDLKAVAKAILLDPELWDDIKEDNIIKFKEPLVAYTNFLKAFHVKPFPKWYFCKFGGPNDDNASNCQVIEHRYLFDGGIKNFFGQAPGLAPTVFNFYDNSFIPNDDAFKSSKSVAPEIQIASDSVYIELSNTIRKNLFGWEKNYITNEFMWCYKCEESNQKRHNSVEEFANEAPARGYVPVYYIGANKMLLDVTEELDVMERTIDGDSDGDFASLTHENNNEVVPKAIKALIHHLNQKLTGGRMSQEQEDAIYNILKDERLFNKYDVHDSSDLRYDKKRYILRKAIFPAIRAVVTSSTFMTE